MKPVKEFDGREWPGSLCKFCSHFVPDLQSKHYDIACASCGSAMGILALDHAHHELSDEETQAVLAVDMAVELDRATREKAITDRLIESASSEKDPKARATIELVVKGRTASGIHEPKQPKRRDGWDKRHKEMLAAYHCAGCHGKRRAGGVDFAEVDTHVRHLIACDVCKKHLAWLDLPEDKSPEEQKEAIRLERLLCPGRCTDTHAEMERQIRATVVK
jgi:hypothetical protein